MRFLTSDRFLAYFLDFDPFSFFRIVKKLFLEREPFEYIRSQESFIEMYKENVIGLEPCLTHKEMIKCLDEAVTQLLDQYSSTENETNCTKAEAL